MVQECAKQDVGASLWIPSCWTFLIPLSLLLVAGTVAFALRAVFIF